MPKYYDEDFEQDWEPVIICKKKEKQEEIKTEIPLYRKIITARQKSNLTQHKFAQSLNMKLSLIEKIESGKEIPDKSLITKMNKILSFKIPYE